MANSAVAQVRAWIIAEIQANMPEGYSIVGRRDANRAVTPDECPLTILVTGSTVYEQHSEDYVQHDTQFHLDIWESAVADDETIPAADVEVAMLDRSAQIISILQSNNTLDGRIADVMANNVTGTDGIVDGTGVVSVQITAKYFTSFRDFNAIIS